MIIPEDTIVKEAKKFLDTQTRKINELSFKDLAFDDMQNQNFRDCEIKLNDILQIYFGKAASEQKDSISSILMKLKVSKCLKKDLSRRGVHYRASQIDPNKYLGALIDSLRPKQNRGFNKVIFDGTHAQIHDSKEARAKYSKPRLNKNGSTKSPVIKVHYLTTFKDHRCVGALKTDYNISERVGLCKLAFEASERGEKLHIVADRGLYGTAIGYLLGEMGHKYTLRICANAMKGVLDLKYKNGSALITKTARKKSFEVYENIIVRNEKIEYTFRVVRKKGNSKNKSAVYIMTNDLTSATDDLLEDYNHRQRVEDGFKYLKSYGGMSRIHFNTSLHNIEIALASLFYYISLVEMIAYDLVETPSPEENGCHTINRSLAWKSFFEIVRHKYSIEIIEEIFTYLLSHLLKIRSGRSEERYVLRKKKCKR